MTDRYDRNGRSFAHSDPSEQYLYPHARAYGEHVGRKVADATQLENVATYYCGRDSSDNWQSKRFVATFASSLAQVGAPRVADKRITIYASRRDIAERCAEHHARDESWYLLGLKEC